MSQDGEDDVSSGNVLPRADNQSVPDRARTRLTRRLVAILGLWPWVLLGCGGLATIAWIGALAWFAIRGALHLLHVV